MSENTDPDRAPEPLPAPTAALITSRWGWWVIGALLVVEMTTFVNYARREVTWAYAGAYDQATYLLKTYEIEHDAADRGLSGAIRAYRKKPHPTGVLLPIQGAIHDIVLGPGRVAVLSVNFVYFALFQCAFAATLLWLSRDWWVALAGFALTLALKTTFQLIGGAFNFRIDFVSFCLYGVLLCALVRSRLLLDRRWSAGVGGVAAVLVLFRFITAVYLAGVFGLLAAAFLIGRVFASDPAARRDAARRFGGWGVAIGVLALVTGPVLASQRKAIHDYYVIGHVTSSEKDIRATEYFDPRGAVYYYPRSITEDHTGPAFWRAAELLGAVAAAGAIWAVWARGSRDTRLRAPRGVLLVAVAGFVVPYVVLSANSIKSPVVGAVLLPPLLWAIIAPVLAVPALWTRRPWVFQTAVLAMLLLATGAHLDAAARPGVYTRTGTDSHRAIQALDDLADACEKRGLVAPEVFISACVPEFQAPVMQIAELERRGRWREYRDRGNAITAGEEATHLQRLARADVVVLADKNPDYFRFPYDMMMERLLPRLRAYCDANLIKVGEYVIGERTTTTYVRGHLRVEGLTEDGWVTDRGVTLAGTLRDLQHCRRIELRRGEVGNYLGRVPGVTAEVQLADAPPRPLAASATTNLEAVCVDWEPVAMPAETPVTIRVRFDASFVPRDLGMGTDPRSLVMFVGLKPRTHLLDARPERPAIAARPRKRRAGGRRVPARRGHSLHTPA